MEFLVIAWDGKDAQAAARRAGARGAHLSLGDEMLAEGKLRYAAGILSCQGEAVGSAMIVDFATRSELDAWLSVEPYVCKNVWREWDVYPCKASPSFQRQSADVANQPR